MLGVGDVDQKGEDADDVEPPGPSFHRDNPSVGQSSVKGDEPLAHRKRTGVEVVVGIVPEACSDPGLGDGIRRIHGEEGEHEHHLHEEDDVGVVLRPSFHLRAAEPGDGQDVASDEEHHTRHEHA